jgi:hypothetical protein
MLAYPAPGFATYAGVSAVLEPSDPPTVQVILPLTNQGPSAVAEVQFGFIVSNGPNPGDVSKVDVGSVQMVPVNTGETVYLADLLGLPPHGYAAYARITFHYNGQTYVTQATSKMFRSFADSLLS